MVDHAVEFRDLRSRVIDIVRSRGSAELNATAPATPDWRVRDVLAHLSGVCADIIAGNLDGVATDPWTAAQVELRRDWPINDLITEWETKGLEVEKIMKQFSEYPEWRVFTFDAATHEHDIRGALGVPGMRNSEPLVSCVTSVVEAIGQRLSDERAGSIRFEFSDRDVLVAGAGVPATTLQTSRFEIFRSVTGRRSLAQMTAYEWEPIARPEFLMVASIFSPRASDLVE